MHAPHGKAVGIVGELEAEAGMKRLKGSRSHHEAGIVELAADRELH